MGTTTAVIYVEIQLNADTSPPYNFTACPKTPSFALTNLVNHKPRSANHGATTVRIATTTDGISFTDVGAATGLRPVDDLPQRYPLSRQREHQPPLWRALSMFFGAGEVIGSDGAGDRGISE
jgi:hypothetical protein